MFSRVVAFCLFAWLTILAAANCPSPTTVTVTATTTLSGPTATVTIAPDQCNTGSTVCCQSTASADSSVVGILLGLLGVVLDDLNVLVGLTCDPLTIGGVGSSSTCSQQPLCCENDTFEGLIAIGCVALNINL